jgi:hypothetical protein
MKITAFEVPIFKYQVKDWKVKKKKLLELFNSLDHKFIGNVITSPIDIKSSILHEEIKIFEKEVNLNLSTSEVWFQKYENGMDHAVHHHGPIGFSAVCFIEYNKNNHLPTTFISPFGSNITGDLLRYGPDVEEGDIIFFPSNLHHYAPTNCSEYVRIIMSFNLDINIENKNNILYH